MLKLVIIAQSLNDDLVEAKSVVKLKVINSCRVLKTIIDSIAQFLYIVKLRPAAVER